MKKNYVLITSLVFFICLSFVMGGFWMTRQISSPKDSSLSNMHNVLLSKKEHPLAAQNSSSALIKVQFQVQDHENEQVTKLKFYGKKIIVQPEDSLSTHSYFFQVIPGDYEVKWKVQQGKTHRSIRQQVTVYPTDLWKTITINGSLCTIEE